MRQAVLDEVKDLLRRGTSKVILKEELPDGANALTARFVLAIRSSTDGKIKYKARYVIGAHRNILKYFMVHGAQTVQASSIRLLLALASMFGFDVWSSDVKLAYLQSAEPLRRKVFIKNPAPEFELCPEECFELLLPLYGLCDAGDLWHKTLHAHHIEQLGSQPTKVDQSLGFSFRQGVLNEINGSYVDGLLGAGTQVFRDLCKVTLRRFEMSSDDELPLTFSGFHISKIGEEELEIDQTFYLKNLGQLQLDATYPDFRSMRIKVAWMANTRPHMQLEISQSALQTQERFDKDTKALFIVRYAHDNVAHLKFPKLERKTIRIVGYSDAAYANNYDLTSQLGRIIFLMDDSSKCVQISFKSYKSRRLTRSVLSAEAIAFANLFDDAFALRSHI